MPTQYTVQFIQIIATTLTILHSVLLSKYAKNKLHPAQHIANIKEKKYEEEEKII